MSLTVRLEKKAIRALGIAESFKKGASMSVLAGVVIRSDLVVDGFVFGEASIMGDDATQAILRMCERLARDDINVIIVGGAIISLYNFVDVDRIGSETGVPTICVTFEESEGLEENIRRRFPEGWEAKLESYRRLGARTPVRLKTDHTVYVRSWGVTPEESAKTLDKFTLQGSKPEPVRLAKLLARSRLAEQLRA